MCVLSCIVFHHIWQFCGLKVGVLGTKFPNFLQTKGLQTGSLLSSLFPNVHINCCLPHLTVSCFSYFIDCVSNICASFISKLATHWQHRSGISMYQPLKRGVKGYSFNEAQKIKPYSIFMPEKGILKFKIWKNFNISQ